jgi:hypothetical protein
MIPNQHPANRNHDPRSFIQDPPSDHRKRSHLEKKSEQQMTKITGAIWKAPNQMSLEDQQRNSNINDRPAERDINGNR